MLSGGRKTKHESLKIAITKFKHSATPLEINKYTPKKFSEVSTDTILSNGYTISIKSFTDMQTSVIKKKKINDFTLNKEIHRKWISKIIIKKDGILIFNKTINDNFFLRHYTISRKALQNTICIEAEVNQERSLKERNVCINTRLFFPKEKKHMLFSLKVNEKGIYNLEKLQAYKQTT